MVRVSDGVTDQRPLRVTGSPIAGEVGQIQGLGGEWAAGAVLWVRKLVPAHGFLHEARDATATIDSLPFITHDLTRVCLPHVKDP